MRLLFKIPMGWRTRGSEASQYPQEKKSIEMLLVRATESNIRQTEYCTEMCNTCGVWTATYLLQKNLKFPGKEYHRG